MLFYAITGMHIHTLYTQPHSHLSLDGQPMLVFSDSLPLTWHTGQWWKFIISRHCYNRGSQWSSLAEYLGAVSGLMSTALDHSCLTILHYVRSYLPLLKSVVMSRYLFFNHIVNYNAQTIFAAQAYYFYVTHCSLTKIHASSRSMHHWGRCLRDAAMR